MHLVKNIVIVGGGTAGWMTAAALSKLVMPHGFQVTLIESDKIGTVGVGEATLPHLRYFNQLLGIDEKEFMQATSATFKLGIKLKNWKNLNQDYIHPFGDFGQSIQGANFIHAWLKATQAGLNSDISDFSVGVQVAQNNKFKFPESNPNSVLSSYSYAYHLDAGLYAKFLTDFSIENGVKRIAGEIEKVELNNQGDVFQLILQSGESITGDLFIDCSGFRGLLINQALNVEFDNWQHWLPCDSAVAIASEKTDELLPYSTATAKTAGWQWKIPLQTRVGNGLVYCSQYMNKGQAEDEVLAGLESKPISTFNHLNFKTGKRKQTWHKNVVAIGLSSGFLEPLESTSIYLIQDSIEKLIEFFPHNGLLQVHIDEFNRLVDNEYLRIRDFLIMHYHVNQRSDSQFWLDMQNMAIPESLEEKLTLFKKYAHVPYYGQGLFLEPSWVAVLVGQGMLPENYSPKLTNLNQADLIQMLEKMKDLIKQASLSLPEHSDFLTNFLANENRLSNSKLASKSLYGSRN
ncbi:tryptophan halogenase family protein [Catenovulum maritimum]|uniref:Tryptophan halogenase n=1 Tax=Catenovulum maritimum TaxID=1513271 RepID=A0A0J8GTX3_9ALTE|nr:tryptophan halogenase family protein [Catenovulum maritimum]KMT64138.1 hypothetical protein XM47_15800 [Catenovulum maritimum]